MTLFSRDPVGKALWDFPDMAGRAHLDWLLRCKSDDYEAYVAEQQHTPSLFPLYTDPTDAEVEKLVAEQAEAYPPRHLHELLCAGVAICPQDDPAAVFGEVLGVAREIHVRSALDQ